MAHDPAIPFGKHDLHDDKVDPEAVYSRTVIKRKRTSTAAKTVQILVFVGVLVGIGVASYFLYKHFVADEKNHKKTKPPAPTEKPAAKAPANATLDISTYQAYADTKEPVKGMVNTPLPLYVKPSDAPPSAKLYAYHEWAGDSDLLSDEKVDKAAGEWGKHAKKPELLNLPVYVYLDCMRSTLPDVYLIFLRYLAGEVDWATMTPEEKKTVETALNEKLTPEAVGTWAMGGMTNNKEDPAVDWTRLQKNADVSAMYWPETPTEFDGMKFPPTAPAKEDPKTQTATTDLAYDWYGRFDSRSDSRSDGRSDRRYDNHRQDNHYDGRYQDSRYDSSHYDGQPRYMDPHWNRRYGADPQGMDEPSWRHDSEQDYPMAHDSSWADENMWHSRDGPYLENRDEPYHGNRDEPYSGTELSFFRQDNSEGRDRGQQDWDEAEVGVSQSSEEESSDAYMYAHDAGASHMHMGDVGRDSWNPYNGRRRLAKEVSDPTGKVVTDPVGKVVTDPSKSGPGAVTAGVKGKTEFEGVKLRLVFHVMYYYCDADEKPVVEKPAVEKPAVEKPAVEKPAVENPRKDGDAGNTAGTVLQPESSPAISKPQTTTDPTDTTKPQITQEPKVTAGPKEVPTTPEPELTAGAGSNESAGPTSGRYSCPGLAYRKAKSALDSLLTSVNKLLANEFVYNSQISVELHKVIDNNKQFHTYKSSAEYQKCGAKGPEVGEALGLNWEPNTYVNVFVCGSSLAGHPADGPITTHSFRGAQPAAEGKQGAYIQIPWDVVDPYGYNRELPGGAGNQGAKLFAKALTHYLGLTPTYASGKPGAAAEADACTSDGDGVPDTTPENISTYTPAHAYQLLSMCTTGSTVEKLGTCDTTADNVYNLAGYAPSYCHTHLTPWQVKALQMSLVADFPGLYKCSKKSADGSCFLAP